MITEIQIFLFTLDLTLRLEQKGYSDAGEDRTEVMRVLLLK